MRHAIVLEEDARDQKTIKNTLLAIESTLCVACFSKPQEILQWIKKRLPLPTPSTDPELPLAENTSQEDACQNPIWNPQEDELVCVVVGLDQLGPRFIKLLKKVERFLIQEKFCRPESPSIFVLTTHEKPQIKMTAYRHNVVFNLIFKPFDSEYLKANLVLALSANNLPNKTDLYNQKSQAKIEMLKEVQAIQLFEYGFTTQGEKAISIGAVAKYHHPLFNAKHRIGAFARCISNQQIKPNCYHATFEFFGSSQDQLNLIRRHLRQKNQGVKKNPDPPVAQTLPQTLPTQVALLSSTTDDQQFFTDLLGHTLSNAQLTSFASPLDFMTAIDVKGSPPVKLQHPVHCLIVHAQMLDASCERIADLQSLMQQHNSQFGKTGEFHPAVFVLQQNQDIHGPQDLVCPFVADVFMHPYDRNNISYKVARYVPQAQPKQRLQPPECVFQEELKAANHITIEEISEVSLVMRYYRALTKGEFRLFYLPLPEEAKEEMAITEITGQVLSCTPTSKGSSDHFCRFLFFGLNDHARKYIRRWILKYYISQKK